MEINQLKNIFQFYMLNTNYFGFIFNAPWFVLDYYFKYIGSVPTVSKNLDEDYQEGFINYIIRYELTNRIEKEIIKCTINFVADVQLNVKHTHILKTLRPAFEENIGDINLVKITKQPYTNSIVNFINENERIFKLLTLI
jgi:hypothetical protein